MNGDDGEIEAIERPATAAGSPADAIAAARAGASPAAALAATAAAWALAACGGGGGSDDGDDGDGGGGGGGGGTAPPTATEASRFLAQASMGATRADIARVQAIGYAAWIDEQMALPATTSRWDFLVGAGIADPTYRNSQAGFDPAAWKKLLSGPDTLRQRVTLALSEIFVVSIDGLNGAWKQFSAANYLDLLEAGCFGPHRDLIGRISRSSAMGVYLTFRGSRRENAATGALPDENYARELMQLFTIGLVELNGDGTATTSGGATTPTYGQDDIAGLARVFTGWEFDYAGLTGAAATATPDYHRRPMTNVASRYESGAKTFLGTTIPAGTSAEAGLDLALDRICGHANVAPFLARQLIQRLVTSNPTPAYVARVGAVFANDGRGGRGNLGAVVKALLLDAEARGAVGGTSFGKLREPMLRFSAWARGTAVASPGGTWNVGNTADPATRLGQSPLRSPSVFNFFRPGYVPPNTAIASAALVAPEFQITHETSVVGSVNFLQRAIAGGVGDLTPDLASLLALADDAAALVAEIGTVFAAGQVGSATAQTIVAALQTLPSGSDGARTRRVQAALLLVFAAPEFIVLK